MKTKQSLFLETLAKLCEEYNAGFYYTIHDDGVHIILDGQECFAGHIYNAESCVKQLREQAKKC